MSRATPSGDLFASLDDVGTLVVFGDDAATFLQGQLTSDVAAVGDGRSSLSAYCDVKGRVVALFRLLMRDEQFLMLMPRETITTARARLELYRMHAKVTFAAADPPLAIIGVSGPAAASRLESLVSPLPAEPGDVCHREGITVIRVDTAPRFEVLTREEALPRLVSALEPIERADRRAWSLLEIRAGLPRVESATSGTFLPQMLRLGEIGAVSFTKGCFPGQEVVARLEHLGAVKRRLYRARVVGPAPAAGTPLRALLDGRDRDGGRVVTAASDGQAAEMLAVVPIDAAERASLHAGTAEGPVVEILDTPAGGQSPASGPAPGSRARGDE